MADYLDLSALTTPAGLPEADVPVRDGVVRVRALTRAEAMSCQRVKDGPDRTAAIERKMLALAMVSPAMTEADVGRWQKASTAGEMEPVGLKVQQLSGMTEGADKEVYQGFDADPDSEFRVPAS